MAAPTGSPGIEANALAQVREALNLLNTTLSKLSPGSDAHKAVYDSVGKLSKAVPPSDAVPGVQQTALRNLGREADQSAMMQALMRSQGAGGGGGAAQPPQPPGAAGASPSPEM